MALSDQQLHILRTYAEEAAVAAGYLIRERQRGPCNLEWNLEFKPGGSSLASQVVTEVDREAEALILSQLSSCSREFNLAVLSEEQEDDGSRFEKDYFWCIDPLDGTLPFTEGRAGYAVSIALVSTSGKPLLGVVYDPMQEQLFSAQSGLGAWCNAQPLVIKERNLSEPFSLIFDRSMWDHPRWERLKHRFECFAKQAGYPALEIECRGGAVMNAMTLLSRAQGAYFKLPKTELGGGSVWDFAATACIYHSLGLSASDFSGEPLRLNPEASLFMNKRGVLYTHDHEMRLQIQNLCLE